MSVCGEDIITVAGTDINKFTTWRLQFSAGSRMMEIGALRPAYRKQPSPMFQPDALVANLNLDFQESVGML